MKNLLNEEINKMKYLLNYNRGLTLSEQKNVINEDSAPGGLGGEWNPATGEYTIVKGDTLSKIGKAFGVKWMDIWEENKDTLRSGKPNCGRYCGYNWIFVGEVVTIPGKAEETKDTDVDTDVDTVDTNVGDPNTDDNATKTPAVVPVTTTADEEPKTKREIKKDCRAEAEKQDPPLKRFTKERREFMRKCKAEGGINAETDEENTPTEDEQTRKEKRTKKRNCREQANDKGLKRFTKERRDFMKKCKAEGGYDSDTQIQSQNVTPTFETTDIEKTLINSIPGKTIKEYNDLQTENEGSEVGISRSMNDSTSESKARTSAQTKLSKKFNTQTLEGVTNIKLTQVNAKPETDGYLYIGLWSKPTNV